MNLPVFEMIINPDETSEVEVSFVALVDKPAIEKNFLTFNSKELLFAIQEDKRIISGPAMVAEQLIYRRDEQGEYNVYFSADTIKQIALKFFKKDYHKNLNLFHDPSLPLDGVTIFESFISDKSRGIHPMKGFEDLPDGSWFISAKIENEAVWQKIKSGAVKGFSVEGIFSYSKESKTIDEQLAEVLNGTLKDISLNTDIQLQFMSGLKELIETFKQKFLGETPAAPAPVQPMATDYQLKDGTPVSVDKLEVGGVVMVAGTPAQAGELEFSDGTKVTVAEGGVIAAVVPVGTMAESPVDYTEQFAAIDQKFSAYEQKFAEQGQTIQKMAESQNKTNETIVALVGIVEKMAQTATADPVGNTPNSFNAQAQSSKDQKEQRRLEISEILNNKNK